MATTTNFINFSLTGDKELAKLFEEFPKSLTDSVLRATGKKALQPVAAMARATAAKDDGDLGQSIVVSTKLSPRQKRYYGRRGGVSVYAGPSHPKGAHGHLVEFGTGPRYHKKTGKYVGIMPAKPFMRPAWDSLSGVVLDTMRTEIWVTLRAAVRRLRKRAEKGTLSSRQQQFFSS